MAFLDNLVPLFTDAAWVKHANALPSPDGKVLTVNATASFQETIITLPANPSTSYRLAWVSGGYTDSSNRPYMYFFERETSTGPNIIGPTYSFPTSSAPQTLDFVTGPRTRFLVISCSNQGVGAFTFSDLVLQRKLPDPPTKNLVLNGGFDTDLTGWTYAGSGTATWQAGKARIDGVSNLNCFLMQVVSGLVPGMTYRFSVRGTRVGLVNRPAVYYRTTRNGSPVSGYTGVAGTPGSGDIELGFVLTVPSNGSVNGVRIELQVDLAANAAGWILWDDAKLVPVMPDPPTKNLVVNGDFSRGATGWNGTAPTAVTGEGTLTGTGTPGGSELLNSYQYVTVQPATVYRVKCTLRHVSGSGTGINFRISWRLANSVFISYQIDASVADGQTLQVDTVLTSPSNAQLCMIELVARGTETIAFSDISFTPIIPTPPTKNLVPLFTDAAWVKHANAQASADGKTLTLNALTTGNEFSRTVVNVLPGTLMTIEVTATGRWGVFTTDGAIAIVPYTVGTGNPQKVTFNTGPRTQVAVYCTNLSVTSGTFSFSNLKLVPVIPNPTANLVVNGDFSQGVAGWTLHSNAQVQDGKLVLNATANGQSTSQSVTVVPSTELVFRADVTGYVSGAQRPHFEIEEWAGSTWVGITKVFVPVGDGTFMSSWVTSPRTNRLNVKATSNAAGTFTFDDISLKPKLP